MDLIIFARYWEPGHVKTRLCPPLTPEQAAAISRHCLDILLRKVMTIPYLTAIIAFEPRATRAEFAARYPRAKLLCQQGDDLTAKLLHLLARRDAPCLITGSDCPTVPPAYYQQAAEALDHDAEVILGSTRDGGSYLLGVRPACREWFRDIPWSTPAVSAALRRRAREHRWRLHELPRWYDIDTIEDLAELAGTSEFADILSILQRVC